MGNTAARGKTDLRQTLSYTFFDRLTAGIKAQEIIWGYDLEEHIDWPLDLKPWVQFKPFIEYRVFGNFTPGFEAGFGFGHLVNDPDPKARKFVNEKYDNYIKPYLSYTFANGLALKAWYKATFIAYADLGDHPMFTGLSQSDIPVDSKGYQHVDSLTKQQIALEFIWSF
jgi:hypothetical protein